ncbi:MAG: tetratricopeptide repeat protein [Ideonella sp.]|nr:tetratricopeptide repeat protein [Ideonella sp.]
MTVDPQALDEHLRQAWHVLCTDPLGVRRAAAAIASLSETDAAVQGHASLFDARGRLSEGDRAGCDAALARAEDWFRAGSDPDGPWACTDLRVMLLTREQRYDEALARLGPALAALPRLRSPVLRHFLLKRHAGVLEQRGSLEEALRAHHASLTAARDCGLPSALALALALLGGLHVSELNHEDALPLCREAWALCDPRWAGMVGWVAPNLMMALSGTGRHEEAAGLARLLLEADPRLLPYQRDRRLFLVGICFARAGQAGPAQHCLGPRHGGPRAGGAAPCRMGLGPGGPVERPAGAAAAARRHPDATGPTSAGCCCVWWGPSGSDCTWR